mgnify:CR=1 FL=1
MKEGSAKKIAQINLDYDNEIAAILTKEKRSGKTLKAAN